VYFLEVDRKIIIKALGTISSDKRIVLEDLHENSNEFRENNKAVYLAKYHFSETSIANRVRVLVNIS
jgi:exodeoxyribonuclease V alpha subunit